jgi:hypothetical protein
MFRHWGAIIRELFITKGTRPTANLGAVSHLKGSVKGDTVSGAQNFEVATKFLENLYTSALHQFVTASDYLDYPSNLEFYIVFCIQHLR